MSLYSFLMNYNCRKSDTARDAGLNEPDTIVIDRDIPYGNDKKYQILDVYRPKEYEGKLPVIVSVHGGGWVYGDKEVYKFYCMSLATYGFAVINFSYRLAPRHKHPCAIEDTDSVFKWLLTYAVKYDIDTDRIFAVGDSAGAQCLALYASILTDPAYAAKYPFKPDPALKIKALGLNCGVYNTEGISTVRAMRDYIPRKNAAETLHDITVINFINDNYPPCYIMTSNGDFLRDEPKALIEQLEKHNIPYQYKEYGDEEHELLHVFHCDIKTEAAKEANTDEIDYFRSFC